MKVKTSITLDEVLVREMDGLADQYGNRSVLIEKAIRAFLENASRRARDSKDLEILNRRADTLNAEAADVLDFQVDL